MDRYALKDDAGNPLEKDVEQMWARVASIVARAEDDEEHWRRIFEKKLLWDFKFIPGGRILSAVPDGNTTFFNCYVLPSPEDSRSGIMDTAAKMVEIMSHGGGVGVNLSTLRPRGARVYGVNGSSSGSVQWGMMYDAATGCVNQGGSRRGALMLVLNVDHPDIVEFIEAKSQPGVLTNCNLSVGISDTFMTAVKKDIDWALHFDGVIYNVIPARWLFNLICEHAWQSGEPGVVFFDRINTFNNTYYYESINCVNPCGEMPLPPWGVCNLGSINLTKFVMPDQHDLYDRVDWDSLAETVKYAVRFLDDVINVTPYVFGENEENQRYSRRVGLGTMGLADMLIMLKVRYGSQKAVDFVDTLYAFICEQAYLASAELAAEKGVFPGFSKGLFCAGKFFRNLPHHVQKEIYRNGLRNAALLTQAPTGSTGLLAGVSSGIEPVFAFEYKRRDRLGEHVIRHPLYEAWLAKGEESLPEYFATAHNVTPDEHVKMQAAIQRWVDASIAKTVNTPKHHTVEDVKSLYMMAYDSGCKGITYYREGSREGVLIKEDTPAYPAKRAVLNDAPARRIKIKTGCGDLWLTCVFDEGGNLREVFTVTGHDGGCAANTEALSRMISCSLRHDLPLTEIVRQLSETKPCRSFDRLKQRDKTIKAKSCPDAIARQLSEYVARVKAEVKQTKKPEQPAQIRKYLAACPDCGSLSLAKAEGCQTCNVCGFSKCG